MRKRCIPSGTQCMQHNACFHAQRSAPNEGKDHLRVRTHERNRHVGHQIAHNEARTRRRQALHASARCANPRGARAGRRRQYLHLG
jgi:hypothetical protein